MKSRSQVQPQSDAILPQAAPIREVQTASHPLLELQAAIGNRAMNQWLAARRKTPDTRQPIQAKSEFQGLAQTLMDESAQAEALPATLTTGTTTSQGKPMPETVQQKMEAAFNTDFSDVRIHEGPEAERIGAIAFTRGRDIHFAPGKYNPTSQSGQELLGHELDHVLQQRMGRVAAPQTGSFPINTDPALEAEADRLGKQAAQGELAKGTTEQEIRTKPDALTLVNPPIQCMFGWLEKLFSSSRSTQNKVPKLGNQIDAWQEGAVFREGDKVYGPGEAWKKGLTDVDKLGQGKDYWPSISSYIAKTIGIYDPEAYGQDPYKALPFTASSETSKEDDTNFFKFFYSTYQGKEIKQKNEYERKNQYYKMLAKVCKAGITWTVRRGNIIHFMLGKEGQLMSDMKEGKKSTTLKELRHIYRNWNALKRNIIFYNEQGDVVKAPWENPAYEEVWQGYDLQRQKNHPRKKIHHHQYNLRK